MTLLNISNLKCFHSLSFFFIKYLILLVAFIRRNAFAQFDIEPEIPSHLPSPPKPDPPPTATATTPTFPTSGSLRDSSSNNNDIMSNIGGFSGGAPPGTAVQNVPVSPGGLVGPGGPFPGPLGPLGGPLNSLGLTPLGLPPDFVPFGLNHIILIIIPQFKARFRKTPKWITSSIKISMPISVFFDKLDLGPAFPPPPGGAPPPGAAGVVPAPGFPGGEEGPLPPGAAADPLAETDPGGYYGGGWYGAYPYPYSNYDEDNDDVSDDDSSTTDDDGYDWSDQDQSSNYGYLGDEDRALRKRRRKKRSVEGQGNNRQPLCSSSNGFYCHMSDRKVHRRRKRSVPFNKTIHASERAVLIPRIENMLESAGFAGKGKACLLRHICEVHEGPLHHYGLLGELFTMFFSVSRSIFAETHLPEYLLAELRGKKGDCSKYYKDCEDTLFSWEETIVSVDQNKI